MGLIVKFCYFVKDEASSRVYYICDVAKSSGLSAKGDAPYNDMVSQITIHSVRTTVTDHEKDCAFTINTVRITYGMTKGNNTVSASMQKWVLECCPPRCGLRWRRRNVKLWAESLNL